MPGSTGSAWNVVQLTCASATQCAAKGQVALPLRLRLSSVPCGPTIRPYTTLASHSESPCSTPCADTPALERRVRRPSSFSLEYVSVELQCTGPAAGHSWLQESVSIVLSGVSVAVPRKVVAS